MRKRLALSIVAVALAVVPVGPVAFGEPVIDTTEVTLKASRPRVTYGSGVVLRGRVTSDDPDPVACSSGVEVAIVADEYNDHPYSWDEVARVETNENGRYRTTLMPANSANYRAEVDEVPPGCQPTRSNRVTVRVRLRVRLRPTTTTVERGEIVKLVVKVRPRCEDRVHLHKLVDGKFRRVATKKPSNRCVAVFRRRMRTDAVFRASHPWVGSVAFYYLGGRSSLSAISVSD